MIGLRVVLFRLLQHHTVAPLFRDVGQRLLASAVETGGVGELYLAILGHPPADADGATSGVAAACGPPAPLTTTTPLREPLFQAIHLHLGGNHQLRGRKAPRPYGTAGNIHQCNPGLYLNHPSGDQGHGEPTGLASANSRNITIPDGVARPQPPRRRRLRSGSDRHTIIGIAL